MISPAKIRSALAEVLDGVDATVISAGAMDGLPPLPAVVVGMPRWVRSEVTVMADKWEIPVAVVVAAAGTSPTAELARLEELWPAVAQRLVEATETDQTLAAGFMNAAVRDSEFGTFTLQGQEFPCQIINLEIAA